MCHCETPVLFPASDDAGIFDAGIAQSPLLPDEIASLAKNARSQ
jgi:hypothetical protein